MTVIYGKANHMHTFKPGLYADIFPNEHKDIFGSTKKYLFIEHFTLK